LAGSICVPFLLLFLLRDWNHNIPQFLALYFAAFALYGLAARFCLRGDFSSVSGISFWIFLFAILVRLAVVFLPPSISEDFYRYVWDGRVQMAGFSPYDHAPRDPEVRSVKDHFAEYDKMHQTEYKSPYPPAAEDFFRLLAHLYPSLTAIKLSLASLDI